MTKLSSLFIIVASTTISPALTKIYLALYSNETFVNITSIETTLWIWQGFCFWIVYASRSLISQFHGNKEYHACDHVLVQNFWLCFIFGIISILLTLLIYNFNPFNFNQEQLVYFCAQLVISTTSCLVTSYISYMNGIKKFKICASVLSIGIVLKMILDPIFIFGIAVIPEFGAMGAVLSLIIVNIIQATLFCSQHKRISINAEFNLKFNKSYVFQIAKIGSHQAGGHLLFFSGWSYYHLSLANSSDLNAIIISCSIVMYQFISFFSKVIGEGVLIYAGNHLGAQQALYSEKIFTQSVKLYIATIIMITIIAFAFMEKLIAYHLKHNNILDLSILFNVKCALLLYLLFCYGEGIRTLYFNLFLSAVDIKVLLYHFPVMFWLFNIVPAVYYMQKSAQINMVYLYMILCAYITVALIYSYIRYKFAKWKDIKYIHSHKFNFRQT